MAESDGGAAECVMMANAVEVKEKTGGVYSCSLHFLTALVGVAVLAVSQALGNLGWVAGPITLTFVVSVAILVSRLLSSIYEVDGVQHPRFYEAVGHILGKRSKIVAGSFQLAYLTLLNIALSITATICMRNIANLACRIPVAEWNDPPSSQSCFNTKYPFTLIFGGAMVLAVQLTSLEASHWLSLAGSVTSMIYPLIALGLCIARVAQGHRYGTVGGISYDSSAAKAFAVLNAIGTFLFSFSYSGFYLEIQDTIKEPPKAQVTMNKAAMIVLGTCGVLYGILAIMGYLALGDVVPDNILTAFDSPQWLLIIANVTVVINMVATFNILAQTTFLTLEGWVARLMGVRHPAEETALQAAAVAAASQHHMVYNDSISLAPSFKGEDLADRKASGGSMHLTGDDARATSAPPGLYQISSRSLEAGHAMASQALPSAALSAACIRQRSFSAVGEGRSKRSGKGSGRWGESSFTEKSNTVIHAVADLREEEVSFIAGPYRMTSALKCERPAVHSKTGKSLNTAASHAPSLEGGPSLAPVQEDVATEQSTKKWRYTLFSAAVRSAYVAFVIVIAVVMPFFSQVAGLIGGLVFWPLNVYFPFSMYKKVHNPSRGSTLALNLLMYFTFLVSLGAVIGSFRNIVVSWASSFCFAC